MRISIESDGLQSAENLVDTLANVCRKMETDRSDSAEADASDSAWLQTAAGPRLPSVHGLLPLHSVAIGRAQPQQVVMQQILLGGVPIPINDLCIQRQPL